MIGAFGRQRLMQPVVFNVTLFKDIPKLYGVEGRTNGFEYRSSSERDPREYPLPVHHRPQLILKSDVYLSVATQPHYIMTIIKTH